MNSLQHFSITFGSVLLIGGLAFIHQTRRLGEIRQLVKAMPAVAESAGRPLGETSAADQSADRPAMTDPQQDTDAAEKFIGKLKRALAAALTEDQVAAFLKTGGRAGTFECLAAAVDLTLEESATIREGLEKYDGQRAALYANHDLAPATLAGGLAGLKRRHEEWLAGQLGPERYAALNLHQERRTSDSAKLRAAASVSRIAAATELTEAQRQQLNEGFLELNLRPTLPAEDKLVVETFGNLTMGPPAPDLSSEAEKILTPEQLENYQIQQEAAVENTEAQSGAMMEMMESLLPAVIKLLETDR